jgi:hypothetical protein
MTPMQLLMRLRSLDVTVSVVAGKVSYAGPVGVIDADLRRRLDLAEAEIQDLLTRGDEVGHTTRFITMRDNVRLAADIFRPAAGGVVVDGQFPVIWCHDRYHRSQLVDGVLVTKLDTRPWLVGLIRHGYVVVVVDARGSGGSTGTRSSEFGPEERQDAYEVTEWLASQPWSTGRIGMFGDSYSGIAQFVAMGARPPHLVAVLPQMALFDLYGFLYAGGVLRHDFLRRWNELVAGLDATDAVPVAGGEHLVGVATAAHRGNADVFARAGANPFRDSVDPELGSRPYVENSPSGHLDDVTGSGIAVYQIAGWRDLWVRDALCWYQNLGVPQRLLITGDSHNSRDEVDLEREHLRWFDHWLKEDPTDVMDGAPIRYRLLGGRPGEEWRTATQWPPAGVTATAYFFDDGPTGTCASVNDGRLTPEPAAGRRAAPDEYVVDYTATTGSGSRWAAGYNAEFGYPTLNDNDAKGLTYTTDPLAADTAVVGHPVALLWIMASHPDVDLFVYLERVAADGSSHYVTEGVLRASHRAVEKAPHDNFGLPYHPGRADTVEPLPGTPVDMTIDLHPIAQLFRSGERIRITLAGCDRDNAGTPVHHPPPLIHVLRHGRFISRVELPVLDMAPAPDA